ncbi:protocadherin-15 [Elysia marginata]|uniref:Protocadherin-15 n=1 Tax=Elysia marginata TaxID=1093978 RepID=A0AAV4H068_9GAST|nr:protocadherin-15 [Elysia marginata]
MRVKSNYCTLYPPLSFQSRLILTLFVSVTGSTVLELPTAHGESWTLSECDVPGYLNLEGAGGDADHVNITFIRSPDIEELNQDFSARTDSLSFTLECDFNGWKSKFDQKIVIEDVNEHPPEFGKRFYNVNVSEADGRDTFGVSPDKRHIILTQPVDYDVMNQSGNTSFGLNISATDIGDPYPLTAYATLNVTVVDVDDQGPVFTYPGCHRNDGFCSKPYYQAVIKCGYVGPLVVYPSQVSAQDRDTQNYSIIYSIVKVEPKKFGDKFEVSQHSGEIRVVKPSCALKAAEILLTVAATENSSLQHSEMATVQIDLLANSAIVGKTPEKGLSFPVGTHTVDHRGNRRLLEPSIREPVPSARRAREASKTATAETTSNTASSTSISTNSTHRSATERHSLKSNNNNNPELRRLPTPFVPTAISAAGTGYCRSGLFISCGEHADQRYDQTHPPPYCPGIARDGEEIVSNDVTSNSTTCKRKGHGIAGQDMDKESKENTHFKNDQDIHEDRTVKERLKNKLNKILPRFLRDENPKVRFDDKNIWAFQEETQSIIY